VADPLGASENFSEALNLKARTPPDHLALPVVVRDTFKRLEAARRVVFE